MSSSQPAPPPSATNATTEALYIGTASGIAGYAISPNDGSLSALSGSPFAPSVRALSLIANPAAPFILAEDLNSGYWALRVNAQGALETTANLPLATNPHGFPSLGVSASGKTIFLGNYLGPLLVSAHSFDVNTGSISPSPTSQTQFPNGCGDPSLCSEEIEIMGDSTAPSAEYLWVQFTNCGFHMDCDNPLEPVAVSNGGATLAASPVGATNSGGSSVSAASVFPGGAVVVQQLTCCTLTSIGSYVLQNGKLMSAAGCAVETAACASAWSVAIHPNQTLVMIGTTDNTLLTATRDAAGNLSMPLATNIRLPMAADKLLLDGSGQHLYVLGSQNLIFGFAVDAATGTLKAIAGSPWSAPAYTAATGVIAKLPRQ